MRRFLFILVLALSGCGGGGTSSDGGGVDPRLARIDIYETQRIRVLGDEGAGVVGMVVADPLAMPTTGVASFEGAVTIRAELASAPAIFAGDAAVTMDFGAGDVGGVMDDFFGIDPNGVLRAYDGTVDVVGGSIGSDALNVWSLDYAGTLTAPGQTLVLGGTVDGTFLDTPVAAIAGSDLQARMTYNGDDLAGLVTLVGEGVVVSP